MKHGDNHHEQEMQQPATGKKREETKYTLILTMCRYIPDETQGKQRKWLTGS